MPSHARVLHHNVRHLISAYDERTPRNRDAIIGNHVTAWRKHESERGARRHVPVGSEVSVLIHTEVGNGRYVSG